MGAGASVPNEGQEFQSPRVGGATWKLLVKKYKKEDIVHRKKGKETLRDHREKFAFWRMECNDEVYMITLVHDLLWGGQKILANGVCVHEIKLKFKLVGRIKFEIGSMSCTIDSSVKNSRKAGHPLWCYELFVNGRFVERLERTKGLHVWRIETKEENEEDEKLRKREIQFNAETMNVYLDRKLVDTESSFADVGSIFEFVTSEGVPLLIRVVPDEDEAGSSTKFNNVSVSLEMNGEVVEKLPESALTNIDEIREGICNVNEETGASTLIKSPAWGGPTQNNTEGKDGEEDAKLTLTPHERKLLEEMGGRYDDDDAEAEASAKSSDPAVVTSADTEKKKGDEAPSSKTTEALVLTAAERQMLELDGAKIPEPAEAPTDDLTVFERALIEKQIEEDEKKKSSMALLNIASKLSSERQSERGDANTTIQEGQRFGRKIRKMGRGTTLTLIDVVALVRELRGLVLNKRVQNVYSLNRRTYLFKFNRPGVPKVNLLVESGVRMHATRFVRDKDTFPLPFAMKLRKHLKSRRVTGIRQVGIDRVIDMTVGVGEKSHHVIFEFYASGNVILTDASYRILDLLRTHTYYEDGESVEKLSQETTRERAGGKSKKERKSKKGREDRNVKAKRSKGDAEDSDVRVRVGELYPLEIATRSATELMQGLSVDNISDGAGATKDSADEAAAGAQPKLSHLTPASLAVAALAAMRDDDEAVSLRWFLVSRLACTKAFGPALVDHCIAAAAMSRDLKLQRSTLVDDTGRDAALAPLVSQLRTLPRLLASIAGVLNGNDDESVSVGGYIILGKKLETAGEDENASTANVSSRRHRYKEFTPVLLAQHRDANVAPFESFNGCMDEFYSRVEVQRSQTKRATQAKVSLGRVEKVRQSVNQRMNALSAQSETNIRRARAIEGNASLVDAAIRSVKEALSSGIDWKSLGDILKTQRRMGHPVASAIVDLKLEDGAIRLQLPSFDANGADDMAEEDDVEAAQKKETKSVTTTTKKKKKKKTRTKHADDSVRVDVQLELSAYANAQRYYTMKKASYAKYVRTRAAADVAVSAAERKHAAILKKKQDVVQRIKVARKRYWFQKFDWFVTPEGYLVLSGRDAQQNEMLVKRYLRKGIDVFVHADLHGAACCIVRNHRKADVVAAETTNETGQGDAASSSSNKCSGWSAEWSPIPPSTLELAGTMTVCRSHAWNERVLRSAWWVHADQVSKTAPSGQYLPTGSFIVRGKKNALTPHRLEMGMGLLFRVATSQEEEEEEEEAAAAKEAELAKDDDKNDDDDREEETGSEKPEEDVSEKKRIAEAKKVTSAFGPSNLSNQRASLASHIRNIWTSAGDRVKHNTGDYVDALREKTAIEALVRNFNARVTVADIESDHNGTAARQISKDEAHDDVVVGDDDDNDAPAEESPKTSMSPPSVKETQTKKTSVVKLPRGKRSKVKRMKKKYKDQSEEDRMLAMALLGHRTTRPSRSESTKAKSSGDVVHRSPSSTRGKASIAHRPNVASSSNFARQSSQGCAVPVVTAEDSHAEVLELVHNPTAAQLRLSSMCVPVVAPYGALGKYAYKVKVVPGKQKRGKAVKAAVAVFLTAARRAKNDAAVRLISDMPVDEATTVMLGDSDIKTPSNMKGGGAGKSRGNSRRGRGKGKGKGKTKKKRK
eukprot:g1535.t1